MFTKPLVQPSIAVTDSSRDISSINRLLAAAAISPRFRSRFLADPGQALKAGFGGEHFPFSRPVWEAGDLDPGLYDARLCPQIG